MLIVDHYTRYMWVFLSKNKKPPLNTLRLFLKKFNNGGITDQGGELASSEEIKKIVAEMGFALEITGSDSSHQNGIVERPHRTLANMMRSSLLNSGLSA